nr:unnamed protein product [Callosobruchus analis]
MNICKYILGIWRLSMPSLENFDCDGEPSSVGLRWQKWKRALQIYLDAAGIENSNKRKAVLLHFGGIGLQEIFYNLPGADVSDNENSYNIAIEKLNEYFTPRRSKVYERHLFRLLKQENGEKLEKFLVRLRHQAAKCQFSTSLEEQLVDQITEKCLSTDLRKKILAMGDTANLNTIIAEANSLETIKRQIQSLMKSHWHRQVALSTLLLQRRI